MGYPFYRQFDSFDCGPTCLQMVSEYFGEKYNIDFLRDECFITRNGVSLLGISQAAEKIGFRTLMVKLTLESLLEECPLPAILHWNQEHFVVIYKVTTNLFNKNERKFIIADPAIGVLKLSEGDFLKFWRTSELNQGIALLLEPTAFFYDKKLNSIIPKDNLKYLLTYLYPFKKSVILLSLCMLISVGVTITLPYVTKGLIDKGVIAKSYNLIVLFIFCQLALYVGSSILDIIRGWILLHMNAKISLNIISDFLKKLMGLPIRFFDTKSVGDVSQRINDHHRIETFLTTDIISTLFSSLQIIVLSTILFFYNIKFGLAFVLFSLMGISWIFLFQSKRKKLDYLRFTQSKTTQEKLFELIVGMQEIKLYGSETEKRWEWEHLQIRQYTLNIKSLKLEQYQQTGFIFLSQSKNVIVTLLASIAVMNNQISLGLMLSISFIIGQTNGPLQQLIQFFKSAQDAKLSFSRLQEVHQKDDEERLINEEPKKHKDVVVHETIHIKDLDFQYQGPRSPYVLKEINITIPKGKITAIVGASGSGKTTLMKLLLGFYQPSAGNIFVGDISLSEFSPKDWREQCGTVMQDGYIFYDTIKKNIVMDGKDIHDEKFEKAVSVSNISEFVDNLPLKYNTRIGSSGLGLSGGQKQRILIGRAVYKNPNYLFFDEATSSLDANNETEIMEKLDTFFIGKTVVIIAHRLSTVKEADQIIVLEKGKVVETGNHLSLTTIKGRYFNLVKNQLELGS